MVEKVNTCLFEIVYRHRDQWYIESQRVTASNNEWYNKWQRMRTCNKEWQQVLQRMVQRVAMGEND